MRRRRREHLLAELRDELALISLFVSPAAIRWRMYAFIRRAIGESDSSSVVLQVGQTSWPRARQRSGAARSRAAGAASTSATSASAAAASRRRERPLDAARRARRCPARGPRDPVAPRCPRDRRRTSRASRSRPSDREWIRAVVDDRVGHAVLAHEARASPRKSFASTPRKTRPLPCQRFARRCSSSGASSLHGPHHDAQKLTTTTLPRSEASESVALAVEPLRA